LKKTGSHDLIYTYCIYNPREAQMQEIHKAKIFKNGGSQAIRIPAQWRFNSDEVFVRFDESLNALVITQRHPKPLANFFALAEKLGPIPEDEWPTLDPIPDSPRPGWLELWLEDEK
jgi:antitoxin VapB